MANTRVCKVCGKEYEYCKTVNPREGIFRWQDVACSKEHGMEYFDMIAISRGEKTEAPKVSEEVVLAKGNPAVEEEEVPVKVIPKSKRA